MISLYDTCNLLQNKVICVACLMQVDLTYTIPIYNAEFETLQYRCQVCKPIPRIIALKRSSVSILALVHDDKQLRKSPLFFVATHAHELEAQRHIHALVELYQVPTLDDYSFFTMANELKQSIPVGYTGSHGMFRIVYEDGSVQSTYNPEIVEALVEDSAQHPEHVQITQCYCEFPPDTQSKLHLVRTGYLVQDE